MAELTPQIATLIDKQDNFEIIAEQIANILKAESASQVELAKSDGKSEPDMWNLEVYLNRAAPWDKWRNATDPDDKELKGKDKNFVPIINIWFDSDTNNPLSGNTTQTTQRLATFNIDCYAYGIAKDKTGEGHTPGDLMAANNVWRAARLVRNILIAEPYKRLKLKGVVGKRQILSRTYFQPQQNGIFVPNVIGLRIALEVYFIENAPESAYEDLELIKTEMTVDGEVTLVVEQEFPSS